MYKEPLTERGEQTFTVDREIATIIGLSESILLVRLIQLIDTDKKELINDRYWVRCTFHEWHAQFRFWSEKTIKRHLKRLENLRLIDSFVPKSYNKAKYYTVNQDRFDEMFLKAA